MRAADLPLYYNAVDILEHNLADLADKVAVYSAERVMTFREVSHEVNQVGNALQKYGDVRMGDFVGILVPDSAEWAVAFFAILKIGAVAVGINTLLKKEDYAYILRDSRARVLIVHEDLLPVVETIRDAQPFLKHVVVIGRPVREGDVPYQDWIHDESRELEVAPTHRDDFCTLNYSSGTTGEPKGILHSHKDFPLTAELWGAKVPEIHEDDCVFAVPRLFFTYGLISNLTCPWYAGASVIFQAAPARNPITVLETIDHFKPTVFFNVPTGYAILLSVEDFARTYDLSSIRRYVSAGETLPSTVWHEWKEKTGIEIIDNVGSTEVLSVFLANSPGEIRPGSSGKPIPGFEMRVIDSTGNQVAPGEIGDLMVKGETSTLFYLHQYEKSRHTFRGEWVFTGDKYYVDEDGYYWHAGRADDMLKVGGIWVSPMEVEDALLNHPAVAECAVVGHPDQANLIKPKGFVVLRDGFKPSDQLAEELIGHCRQSMAPYKRPRWIEFVDRLPKTSTGKIQRGKLRG